jgi:hypothetical protein
MKNWILIICIILLGQNLFAQNPVDIELDLKNTSLRKKAKEEKQIIWQANQSFGNPSIPATLQITHYQGDISVEGYTGKEVLIEAWLKPTLMDSEPAEKVFQLLENNNLMALLTDSSLAQKIGTIQLQIKVPEKTTLKIQLKKSGNIQVKNVSRLVEVDNRLGSIYLQDLSGWAIAQTESGKIEASFKEIVANQPMSFITLTGEIDLKLPPDLAADFRVRSANGLINNEFGEVIKADSLTNLNYLSNKSQSANFMRGNEILLQEKKLGQKQAAAARANNDRSQLEQKTKSGANPVDTQVQNLRGGGEEDLKSNFRNRRGYHFAQTYIGKANEGGGLIYVSTRTGEVKIRKTTPVSPALDKK